MSVDLWDLIAVVGVVLIAIGAWLIFPPAALIAAGFSLVAIAWRFTPKQGGS